MAALPFLRIVPSFPTSCHSNRSRLRCRITTFKPLSGCDGFIQRPGFVRLRRASVLGRGSAPLCGPWSQRQAADRRVAVPAPAGVPVFYARPLTWSPDFPSFLQTRGGRDGCRSLGLCASVVPMWSLCQARVMLSGPPRVEFHRAGVSRLRTKVSPVARSYPWCLSISAGRRGGNGQPIFRA